MSRQLVVRIRSNETVRFPGICTNCTSPATESMVLSKRDGQRRRFIEVPLCAQCARLLKQRSAAEERLQKLRWLFAAIFALLLMGIVLLAVQALSFWPRLIIALLAAAAAAAVVIRLFDHWIAETALPEKKAVLASSRLVSFTRRTATFEFENQTFVKRFVALNEQNLLNHEGFEEESAGEGAT